MRNPTISFPPSALDALANSLNGLTGYVVSVETVYPGAESVGEIVSVYYPPTGEWLVELAEFDDETGVDFYNTFTIRVDEIQTVTVR